MFDLNWEIAAKDPEKLEIVEPVLDVEPEKEKFPAASRSNCMRSSSPGRVKRKPTKKRRIRTQDMIESVEDGCLLLGLTQDVIVLDQSLKLNPLLLFIQKHLRLYEMLLIS